MTPIANTVITNITGQSREARRQTRLIVASTPHQCHARASYATTWHATKIKNPSVIHCA